MHFFRAFSSCFSRTPTSAQNDKPTDMPKRKTDAIEAAMDQHVSRNSKKVKKTPKQPEFDEGEPLFSTCTLRHRV